MMRNTLSYERVAQPSGDLVAFPAGERNQIPIVVIDRRSLIRECLARCLATASGCKVVAFASVEEWLRVDSDATASLVLFSTASAQQDAETQRQIALLAQKHKDLPAVVMSDGDEPDHIVDALDKGVRGYIPTGVTLDVAVGAIGLVGAGGTFVPATSLVAARRAGESTAARQMETSLFTARQASVVEGIRRGKPNKIIAYELNMCESTVKVHVRAIMKKLKATNRTEVAFKTNALFGSLEQASV
jgi:DNA-binding NarL/FixJ family response regulator